MKNNEFKFNGFWWGVVLMCFMILLLIIFNNESPSQSHRENSQDEVNLNVLRHDAIKDNSLIQKKDAEKKDQLAFAKKILEVGTDAYVHEGVDRLLSDAFEFRQSYRFYKGLPRAQLIEIKRGLKGLRAEVMEKEKTLFEVREVDGGSVIRIPPNEELQDFVEDRLREIAVSALGREQGELLGELWALDPAVAWLSDTIREVSTVFRVTDTSEGEEIPFLEIRYFDSQTEKIKRTEEYVLLSVQNAKMLPLWKRYNHLANFESVGASL